MKITDRLDVRNVVKNCVILFTVISPFFYFLTIKDIFPFYFQFDTDATVTIDTILINSGLLPEHINHPSYGMYILLSLITRIIGFFFASFGFASDLNSLIACKGGVHCIAVYASFLQFFSKAVAASSASLLLLIVWRLSRSILAVLTAAFIFILDEGLIYNSLIIKSELYSFFFFVCSLYFLALAHQRGRIIYIFWAGLLAGLCYFTKVQFVIYVAFLGAIVTITNTANDRSNFSSVKILVIFTFVLFIAVTAKYFLPGSADFRTGPFDYFNKPSILFWIAFLLFFVCNCLLNRLTTTVPNLYQFLRKQIFFFCGFSASLLMAVFANGPIFGSMLSAQAYRMAIARDLTGAANFDWTLTWGHIEPWQPLIGLLIIVPCISLGLIIAVEKKRFSGNLNRVLFIAGILLITLINLFLVMRPTYRDLFPAKSLLLVFTVLYSSYVIGSLVKTGAFKLATMSCLFLSLIIPIQYMKSAHIPELLNAENTHYGYNINFFVTGVYGGNHNVFHNAVRSQMDINGYKAKAFREEDSIYATMLPNLRPECAKLIPNAGYRLKVTQPADSIVNKSLRYRMLELSSECMNSPNIHSGWSFSKAAIVYDFFSLSNDTSESIEILPRSDVNLFLFADEPLELKYLNFYSKTQETDPTDSAGSSDHDWDVFVERSNQMFEGVDPKSGKIIYIYLINRYTRLYLHNGKKISIGYSETF